MLKITNLETTYNDIVLALKGISIEITPGQIVTLLGANGAGKSTTINAISGIRNTINLEVEDGVLNSKVIFLLIKGLMKLYPKELYKSLKVAEYLLK